MFTFAFWATSEVGSGLDGLHISLFRQKLMNLPRSNNDAIDTFIILDV